MGTTHSFETSPKRIISLVPSQTELLHDLGLEDRIIGITKFCVHPYHFKSRKKIVGGTKKVHFEKIKLLEPDIIICNKEENTQEIVDELRKICPSSTPCSMCRRRPARWACGRSAATAPSPWGEPDCQCGGNRPWGRSRCKRWFSLLPERRVRFLYGRRRGHAILILHMHLSRCLSPNHIIAI